LPVSDRAVAGAMHVGRSCDSCDGDRLLNHSSRDGLPRDGADLILLFTDLLTITLASKRFFHTLLLTWFQIKRVTFDFLDNVFCLHFAFESAQGIFKGFAFLNSNLCHERYTSKRP